MPDLTALADWAQILSLPIAILATAVSVWLYLRGRQRRRIVCEFDPIAFLVEIKAGAGLEGNIDIRYQGIPIDNLFLLRVKLRNAGNIPIRRQDIVKPVTFTFAPSTFLIQPPRVVNKRPDNLTIQWSLSSSDQEDSRVREASMSFDLLNPDDEVMVEFLCAGTPLLPSLTARIEGIKKLAITDPTEERYKQKVKRAGVIVAVIVGSTVGSSLGSWFLSPPIPDSDRKVIGWFVAVVATLGGGLMLWVEVLGPVYRWARYRATRGRGDQPIP